MSQQRSDNKAAKEKDPRLDLSVGEILAASGATTLGALLVKLLDIWGTLLGTAILSVFTSVGAVLILRTLRKTSERVKAQLAALSAASGKSAPQTPTVRLDADTVDFAAEAPVATEPEPTAKAHSPRRTLLAILISSVLVFTLTVGVLTLLGGITTGDPTRYFEQPVIIYETEEGGVQVPEETGPGDTAPEPTESTEPTGGEETTVPDGEEPETEDPAETAPTDEPTDEATSPGTSEEQNDAAPSPSPQDEEAPSSPTPTQE
ncbi:hypothetical protein GCM10027447_24500 [Glycomyces halotolerans]